MAKIILSMGGAVLREMALARDRITIGRRPHNDIVIDDLSVSGDHAVLVRAGGDYCLEDLNSTNGTQVNGQPVRQHFLRARDIIALAQYRITYLADSAAHADGCRTTDPAGIRNVARIRVLDGSAAGRETPLSKAMTTVGRPDADLAVIIRQPHGFTLAHVEGRTCPAVNGKPIGKDAYRLQHGDVIDLAAGRLQFLSH